MKSMPWRATAVSALGAALLVSACSCDPETAAPTLTLVAPRDGQTVNRADDLDPSREGVQVEAEVAASGLDGSTVTLAAAEGTFAEVTAKIENGRATLVYTLSGSVKLVASATDAQARTATSAPATVTFDDALRACRFLVPADGATLGQDGDESATDGFQVTARVRCVGVELGNPIELFVGGARWAGNPLGAGGIASFPSVEFAEGANVLEARTKTNAGEAVTARSAVTVDTGACRVTVQPPTATIFNARGEGQGAVADLTPGGRMNARLAIDASACPGATITLKRGTAALATLTAASAAQTVDVELEDGIAELRAILGGSARGASPLVRYSVDAVVPTLVLDAPAGGESFHDGDDTAPALPGLQVEVRGRFTGIGAGRAFEIVLEPGTAQESVLAGVLPADERFSVPVTLANGSHQLLVRARRASGSTAASPSLAFSSSFLGASLAFASPADGARVTLANDAKPDVAGFQIGLSLVATNLDGSSGQLTCSGQSVPFTIATGGRAEVDLSYVLSGCGASVQSCVARITAAGGSVFETATIALLVDPTPPTVVLLAPEAGAVLSTSLVTVSATTSCPGETQSAVLLRGTDVLAGPAPIVGNALSFADVALFPGESALVLRVSDEAGNATPVPFTVIVDSAVPVVSFLEPATTATAALVEADDQQGTLADGLQHDVVVEVSNELVGTAVELSVGGRAALVVRTVDENGRKIARFAKVSLQEGDTRLIACATDEALGRGCRTLDVNVSTGRPSCVVSAPADGAVLGQSADLDGVQAGLQADVTVTTSAAAGTLVQLELTGPDGVSTTASAAVAEGLATFAARTFAVEGAYVLQASCRNDGGVPGLALANHVAVDFSAPTFTILEPEADQLFNLASPDRGAAEGFQLDVRVQVDEAAPGAWVTLETRCGGAPATFGPVAVNAQQLALFRAIDVPSEGACDLTVTVTDVAGNVAAPVVRHIAIDRVAPTVTFDLPSTAVLYGKNQDARPETASFELGRVLVSAVGASGTAPVTLRVGASDVTGAVYVTTATRVNAEWTNVSLAEGPNTLIAAASDAAGNTTTAQLTATVDTLGPVVSISSHSNGQILTARADVDALAAGLQVNVTLAGQQLGNGTTVRICSPQGPGVACRGGAGKLLAAATLNSGAAVIPRVTFPEGAISVYAEATDLAGNEATSSTLNVTVDTIAPVVEALTLAKVTGEAQTTLDTLGGFAVFGAAGDAGAAIGFQTRISALLSGVAPNGILRATFVDSNPVAGTVLGTAVVAADGTVSLDVTLPDGGHRLHVLAVDAVGNPSSTPEAPLPGVTPRVAQFAVDLTPPALALVAPRAGALLAKDDKEPATAGLQTDLTIDSDAGAGRSVQVTLDGAPFTVLTLPLTGRAATARVTLPEGLHSLGASVNDAAGNTSTIAPVPVSVDSVAPVISITQPTSGQSIATDADPAADGFQIAVQLAYSQVEEGRTIALLSSIGGELATTTTQAGGTAVFPPLTVPGGAQQLTARVADASGNVSTSLAVGITVELDAPLIRFVSAANPLLFGLAAGVSGGNCQIQLQGTSDTEGASVQLLLDQAVSQTATVEIGGNVTFPNVVIAAGATVTLQLRATVGAKTGFSAPRLAICDLTAPTVAFTNPVAGSTTKYVAAGNPGGVAGAREDALPSSELDADFALAVTGAAGGSLVLSSSVDGEIARRDVASDAENPVVAISFALTRGTHTLTATASDKAGNTTTSTLTANVDTQVPAAANALASIVDGRLSLIRLRFPAPGDDGEGGGSVAGYQVRRAEASIDTLAAWATALPVTPISFTVAAPGTLQDLVIQGLPYENKYTFAVRAVDALGNLAPLGTSPAADLRFARTHKTFGAAGNQTNIRLAVADLDGDGRDDIVAANASIDNNSGKLTIYYGGDILGAPVELLGIAGSRFGSALAAGDVNGDGLVDLVVGADLETAAGSAAGAKDGAVYIFHGRQNVRLTSASTRDGKIVGKVPAADPSAPNGIGFALTLADVDADGKKDIVVASISENSRKGIVYVFAGRADWSNPTELGQPLSTTTHALAAITSTFGAPSPGGSFGRNLVTLGDLNPSAIPGAPRGEDFAVSSVGGTLTGDAAGLAEARPVFIVAGELAHGAVVAENISAALYAVAPPAKYSKSSVFGFALVAGDFTGDATKDLVVSDFLDGQSRLYSGTGLAAALATVGTGTPQANAAYLASTFINSGSAIIAASLGDVTGDGIDDFALTKAGSSSAMNEIGVWHGRSAADWAVGSASVARSATLTRVDLGNEFASFGVRMASGQVLGNVSRDIVVLDLGGGVTILSGPFTSDP